MFRVSCIQLKSNNNIQSNFIKTERLIKKAISQKADFILTPEVSSLFTLNNRKITIKNFMTITYKQFKYKFFRLIPLFLLFFISLNGNSIIDLKFFSIIFTAFCLLIFLLGPSQKRQLWQQIN